ncbi:mitosis initiation protein fs(1)Ya [Anastrepha ludens]|uniref:mitosis initiation protein fs(1)Ya n=1 Tax=Anastrepha ludens TaxID=28586 RepID=UPI0023AF8AE1|nr:mitosis initiation protein fs(1)Ya [Anastrepha ludens]
MKVPSEIICRVCEKVFCCAECRYKHEIKIHAIVVQNHKNQGQANTNLDPSILEDRLKETEINQIILFCPICERKPMPLQRDMYAELLAHVEQYHLPLRCRKCSKVYNRLDELQNFSTCTYTPIPVCCYSGQGFYNNLDNCDSVAMQKDFTKVTISTQTSPQARQHGEFHDTPMSLINLRWKAKSKLTHEEFVSDSISSLKNISSINNSSGRRSLDAIAKPQGQLVRTTSTPVHAELLCTKHTERTFNASGGQVSSIYHSGAEASNHSPAMVAMTNVAAGSPSKQHLESINRYLKVGGSRSKISTATPLRQVMSKSIQKAFAEHGVLPLTRASDVDMPPLLQNMFDAQATDINSGSVGSPLDLRLSPAVRRIHSQQVYMSQLQASNASAERKSAKPPNLRHEVLRSSQKLTTTESIVITRTKHMHQTASSRLSNGPISIAPKSLDEKSTTSSTSTSSDSSGVSTCSGSSMYKSCQSIEIITATTALSEIQQDYYAVTDKIDNAMEKNVPTIGTPITRIPGALINKKLIRFDSPCEEEEFKNSNEIENCGQTDKENCAAVEKVNTPEKSTLSYASVQQHSNSGNAGSKAKSKVTETPRSTHSSVSDVFFTPITSPIRKYKKLAMVESEHQSHELSQTASLRSISFRKSGKSEVSESSETSFDNEKVESLHGETPKSKVAQKSATTLGRSWSFGALLGSVMRLNPKRKSTAKEKIETPPAENIRSDSLIKRCASIAGSLIRTQSLIDEAQLQNQKRKRSYTMDPRSVAVIQNSQNSSGTKRFRIQGRKPIERMRKDI